MARPKAVNPAIQRSIMFDPKLLTLLELQIFSMLEARIPHGKLSESVNEAVRDWLVKRGVNV